MGAPASSMTSASARVLDGWPDQARGGLSPAPRQVYWCGIGTPWPNSELVTVITCGSSARCRAVGPLSRPQPPSSNAAVAAPAARQAAQPIPRSHRPKRTHPCLSPVHPGARSYATGLTEQAWSDGLRYRCGSLSEITRTIDYPTGRDFPADYSGCREFPSMISSQDGTDARRDRPPAAFLTGRSRAGSGCRSAATASSSAGRGPSASRAAWPAAGGPALTAPEAAGERGGGAEPRGSG